jgi:hypothetical protein
MIWVISDRVMAPLKGKEWKVEGGGAAPRDRFYDLSNDLSLPSSPRLDVGKILGLLVKANEMATAIRTRYVSGSVPVDVREMAGFDSA